MIKSKRLLEILQDILDKEEISENDLKKINDLTLNKKKLNGLENDIELTELKYFSNLKTLMIANFKVDAQIIEIINNQKSLLAVQFSRCEFENIIPVNQNIKYLIVDGCQNFNYNLINNNETIKIIGEKIEISSPNNLNKTKELFLQNCDVEKSENLCYCQNLNSLNLDGSKFEEGIRKKLNKNIQISYKEQYHPM